MVVAVSNDLWSMRYPCQVFKSFYFFLFAIILLLLFFLFLVSKVDLEGQSGRAIEVVFVATGFRVLRRSKGVVEGVFRGLEGFVGLGFSGLGLRSWHVRMICANA